MAKRDNKDIFQRLRQVGLRKQAARALSELGDTTSKRAVRAARAVVTELRSLADELEQRLPDATSDPAPVGTPASRAADVAAKPTTTAKTPRGENKAKILSALSSGPKTASQVAADTGIKTGTASTTLTKMLASGEVIKAARGYALPPAQQTEN
jgi:predicted Rossmann fold nucleotide-binding protein DprA/Smf involved in DNA uptake